MSTTTDIYPGRKLPPELTLDQARALVTGLASETDSEASYQPTDAANARPWRIDWATLRRRIYDVDVLQCPCGGQLTFVEEVTGSQALQTVGKTEQPIAVGFNTEYALGAPRVLDG